MLESLSERLQGIFSGLRGKGRLTEEDINSAMREIRLALLEADVNFKVVKQFCARTKERCLTAEVLESLTPAQNVVKIVLDELERVEDSQMSLPLDQVGADTTAVAASAAADVRAAAREAAGQRVDAILPDALLANESDPEQIAEE